MCTRLINANIKTNKRKTMCLGVYTLSVWLRHCRCKVKDTLDNTHNIYNFNRTTDGAITILAPMTLCYCFCVLFYFYPKQKHTLHSAFELLLKICKRTMFYLHRTKQQTTHFFLTLICPYYSVIHSTLRSGKSCMITSMQIKGSYFNQSKERNKWGMPKEWPLAYLTSL